MVYKCGVSLVPVKTNRTLYIVVCASALKADNVVEMCACEDCVPLLPRVQVDTSRLDLI